MSSPHEHQHETSSFLNAVISSILCFLGYLNTDSVDASKITRENNFLAATLPSFTVTFFFYISFAPL